MSDPPKEPAKEEAKRAPLTAKQIAAYVVGAAAVIGALAGIGSQVGSWLRWGLGIDAMQHTLEEQTEQIEGLKQRLRQREQLPDANRRLDQALPRIANAFRASNKEQRGLHHATSRLATIHEFDLDGRRERETAQQVQNGLRRVVDEADEADADDSALDALEGL